MFRLKLNLKKIKIVVFSKPEKLSYEVLNGHQRYAHTHA